MSDKVLERIIYLAAHGYDVRFMWFYSKDAIQIRVSKNNINAARVMSIEEIEVSRFDAVLYAINRLVELVNEPAGSF